MLDVQAISSVVTRSECGTFSLPFDVRHTNHKVFVNNEPGLLSESKGLSL